MINLMHKNNFTNTIPKVNNHDTPSNKDDTKMIRHTRLRIILTEIANQLII